MTPDALSSSFLSDLLRIGGIWRSVKTQNVTETMKLILERLRNLDSETLSLLKNQVNNTGALHWAPLGEGLAMPHLRLPPGCGNDTGLFALLLLGNPMPLPVPTPEDLPVSQLLFFVSPSAKNHIQIVSQISSHLIYGPFKKLLTTGAADKEILSALAANPRSKS